MSAIYLYNRTLNSSIDFKTPYEVKYKAKPNIANIKIQGSLSYKKEPKEFLHKLDARSKPYYLIGYTSNNLYRLLDLKSYKVTLARDVKVLEGTYYRPSKDLSQEDLEIEDESSKAVLEAAIDNQYSSNKKAIKTHPKVVINNKKDREISKLREGTLNASIASSNIIEEVYYTSKIEDCPKNYKEVLKYKEKDNYLAAM